MAKDEKKSKIVLERTYNVPLRKEFIKSPRYKRTNKAVSALRQFLVRHMKSDNIKIGKNLNNRMWDNGIKNPPHSVKINAIKDEKGVVRAELVGFEIELEKKEAKKEGLAERIGLKNKEVEDLTQTYTPKAKEEAETKKSEKPKEDTKETTEKKDEKPAKEEKSEEKASEPAEKAQPKTEEKKE